MDFVPATRAEIDVVYAWMNAGDCKPGHYTQEVDAALCRVLDSAELLLGANHGQ